jgi:carbonic anhydrase
MQLIMWQESITQLRLDDGYIHDTLGANLTDGRLAFLDSEDKMNYYQLTNFHIHAPSEHTFDGKYYDLELHMIHENLDKESTSQPFAVVAIFFDTKKQNRDHPFIESLNVKKVHQLGELIVDEVPLMQLTQQIST